jgi:hypothetical protein
MRYFWWRLFDYATGVFVGGLIVFIINKFFCHKCLGTYTPILYLAVWIAFMLFCNYVFEAVKPGAGKDFRK